MTETVKNRYDFILLFDVKDGNPNGDPDGGNLPRVDPETGHGLVTDVCLKRKVRNYVALVKQDKPPYEIYVKEKAILNKQHERAYEGIGVNLAEKDNKGKNADKVDEARAWMCHNFYDIRAFGAVMSTGDWKCGQVRGPLQLTFARSISPVVPLDHSITRMAVTTEAEAESQQGDNRTMGRKFTIPYGLYRTSGFVSASLAAQTGFTEEDLGLFWEALLNMFEHDHSAARGYMATRKLVIFKHESHLGNAPSHVLFDTVSVKAKDGVARDYGDYVVTVPLQNELPKGVSLIIKT